MKIIIALNHKYIKDKLEQYYEDVYPYDILNKEDVIELIAKEEYQKENIVLITKENLEGFIDNKLFAKQLRVANKYIKIIFIVKQLDKEYKKFLFSNEIFHILEGNQFSVEEIKDCIEENKIVVYKKTDSKQSRLNEEAIDYQYHVKNQVVPKKKIAIYGTSGSGKSYVASLLCKNISKDLNVSLALLDMDIQNPSIDIFNNLSVNNNGLNQMIEDIDQKKQINKIMDKYMIKDKDNKKLWYMTSNTTLFDCQNKLNHEYYDQIYKSVSQNFDYMMIDLPSSPFLDVVPYTLKNVELIYFVVNPNYISIRQAIKYLDLLDKLWDIPKNKVKIIINKIQKDSLDIFQLKSLLSGYEIIGNIDFIKDLESYINGATSEIDIDIMIDKVYESLAIENVEQIIKDRYKNRYKKYASVIPLLLKKGVRKQDDC